MQALLGKPPSFFLGNRSLRVVVVQRVQLSLPQGLVGRSYNPSIARLPTAMSRQLGCTECHVVTVRLDWANGCDSATMLTEAYKSATHHQLGRRKGTLVMVVNSSNRQRHEWEPLSWGWLRLDGKPSGPLVAQTHRIDTPEAMRGAAPLVDVRLFVVAGDLHAIGYDATRGWVGVLGRLHLQVNGAARRVPGRPAALNAWLTASTQRTLELSARECRGRSHAVFDARPTPSRRPAQLAILSWLAPSVVVCGMPNEAVERDEMLSKAVERDAALQVTHRATGLAVAAAALKARGGCGRSASTAPGTIGSDGRLRHEPGSHCRLSLNGVLLRLAGSGTLLGVGHLHRGFRASLFGKTLPQRLAWGAHHYTHFFFEIAARPPHRLLAVGPEFCVSEHGTSPAACEVVQYVTGLAWTGVDDELAIAYGVRDCEPRIAKLSLRSVRRDLLLVGL
jgi:hypothetical protein